MSERIKTKQGYITLKTSVGEVLKWGGLGICDTCAKPNTEGYLVGVLNRWLCEECFREWEECAVFHKEDVLFGEKVIARTEARLNANKGEYSGASGERPTEICIDEAFYFMDDQEKKIDPLEAKAEE